MFVYVYTNNYGECWFGNSKCIINVINKLTNIHSVGSNHQSRKSSLSTKWIEKTCENYKNYKNLNF